MNVVVDHNPEKFMQDIPSFVDQIPEVDHLNLVLTLVGYESQSQILQVAINYFLTDEDKTHQTS